MPLAPAVPAEESCTLGACKRCLMQTMQCCLASTARHKCWLVRCSLVGSLLVPTVHRRVEFWLAGEMPVWCNPSGQVSGANGAIHYRVIHYHSVIHYLHLYTELAVTPDISVTGELGSFVGRLSTRERQREATFQSSI